MEILVSVLGSKSLSQSSIIARSLYSTLQVGAATHRAARVEAEDVPFTVDAGSASSTSLVITLRNGQTQTAMYVRHIPLSIFASASEPVDMWVAVYAPGDPRNQSFTEEVGSALRAEVPQIHLSIRRIPTRSGDEVSLNGLRQTRDRLEEELNQTRQSASILSGTSDSIISNAIPTGAGPRLSNLGNSQRPSLLERHEALAIRETERQAQDIKSKVSAMANAQRHVLSTEQQLQEVIREIEEARHRLQKIEDELHTATADKNRAEREKQEAREAAHRARETLRLRDLSILELKATRDQADRQLSEALSERERQRTEMESSLQRFDVEVRGMGADLDRWRAEATNLSEALQLCDRRVLDLREQIDVANAASEGSAELATLQQQLDEALLEMSAVCSKREQAGRELKELESALEEARKELAIREAQAEKDRQRAKEIRAEAGAAERDLIVQMGRAAQLEGQVSENRNQLRDLEARLEDVRKQIIRQEDARDDLEQTIAMVQVEFAKDESEVEKAQQRTAECTDDLKRLKEKLAACQQRSVDLDNKRREAENVNVRRIDELSETRRLVTSDIGTAVGEVMRLQGLKAKLEHELAEADKEVDAHADDLREVEQRSQSMEQDLEKIKTDNERRDRETLEIKQRIGEIELALEQGQVELGALASEAACVEQTLQEGTQQKIKQEMALKHELACLHAEVEAQKAKALRTAEHRDSTNARKNETFLLLQEHRQRSIELQAIADARRMEAESKKAHLDMVSIELSGAMDALTEQRGKHAQQQAKLGTAKSLEMSVELRETELRESMDFSRAQLLQRITTARGARDGIEKRHTGILEEFDRLKAQHQDLTKQHEALFSALQESTSSLSGSCRERESLRVECENKLQALKREVGELQTQAGSSEAMLADITAARDRLKQEAAYGRVEHAEHLSKLALHRDQLAATLQGVSQRDVGPESKEQLIMAVRRKYDTLKGEVDAAKRRDASLKMELCHVEADAAKAVQIRTECDALLAEVNQGREESDQAAASKDALERTRLGVEQETSDLVAEKNAELDRRIERIDELEREVMTLSSQADFVAAEKKQLEARLKIMDTNHADATDESAEQIARLRRLQQLTLEIDQQKQHRETEISKAISQLSAAEESKSRLEKEIASSTDKLEALKSQAVAKEQERRERMHAIRHELSNCEQRFTETVSTTKQLEAEINVARERNDSARRKLLEKQQQIDLIMNEISDVEREQQAAEAASQPLEKAAGEQLLALKQIEDEMLRLSAGAEQEDQKATLLQDQIRGRQEDLAKARAEAHDLHGISEDLRAELDKFRENMNSLEDKLSYQIEHDKLQFSSIEKLNDDIRTLEGEAEVLTLGLHDAEQQNEFLQKENYLMRQQVEGLYKGTLQDWAAEVHRVKVAAEIERSRDELSHWQQVAEDAERESRQDVAAAQQRHESVETDLRRKLDEMPEELQRLEKKAKEIKQKLPPAPGSVHAVPASLHGLLGVPKHVARAVASNTTLKRKALLVGCNCSRSKLPLYGCANDAWNMQCLLRHSLQYKEEHVRCLIDSSASCPSPPRAQPTKANMLEGMQWLVSSAKPGDNLIFYFSGYVTRQSFVDGSSELCFVPQDFAEDIPANFLDEFYARMGDVSPEGSVIDPMGVHKSLHKVPVAEAASNYSYRLVPFADLRNIFAQVPQSCKISIIIDSITAPLTGVSKAIGGATPRGGVTPWGGVTPRAATSRVDESAALVMPGVTESNRRWLCLPQLSLGKPPPSSSPKSSPVQNLQFFQGGLAVTQLAGSYHYFRACGLDENPAELPIEGAIQGAFTWAFVKAFAACHLEGNLQQHSKALHHILLDLRTHFHWLEQTPVINLGGSAAARDLVLI